MSTLDIDHIESMAVKIDDALLLALVAEVRALRADRDRWQDAYVQARLNQETPS